MRKKDFTHSLVRKAFAVGLSVCMAVPASVGSLGTVVAVADDTLPEPVAIYEAGETKNLADDTTNAPDVVEITDSTQLAGSKAWSLKATIVSGDAAVANTDSAISVANPLIGDTKLVEDITVNPYEVAGSTVYLPEWNEGVTITYWVKTTSTDTSSALISFKGEDTLTIHKDSLMKYRISSQYAELLEKAGESGTRPEDDPTTEFYYKEVAKDGSKWDNFTVYDFYDYALAKGIVTADMTPAELAVALASQDAVPQLLAAVPGIDMSAYICLTYKEDENGNMVPDTSVTKNPNGGSAFISMSSYIAIEGLRTAFDYTKWVSIDLDVMGTSDSQISYGWTTGMLQLRSDSTMFFAEDVLFATRWQSGAETTNTGLQANNYVIYYADDYLTSYDGEGDYVRSPEAVSEEWHYVAYVIKNNEMYCYIDGDCENIVELAYETTFFAGQSFDIGTGLAYPNQYSNEISYDVATGYYNPNCNGMTIMEWLTAETTTTLNIGGVSTVIASTFADLGAAYDTVEGTQIARVKVYDEILDDDTVAALYAAGDPNGTEPEPVESEPAESEPVESEPVESEPAESEPAESEPVESEPVESEPVESEPAESEPVESEPVESGDPAATYYYGDVDLNGKVEASDALYVLQHVVELDDLAKQANGDLKMALADMDGDQDVTATDALYILRTVVELNEKKVYTAAAASEEPAATAEVSL